jgi:hypothetical protein
MRFMLKLGTLGFVCRWVWVASQAFKDGRSGIVLYRYVDSRGVTVLDRQGVPPEYVGKGYEVLQSAWSRGADDTACTVRR